MITAMLVSVYVVVSVPGSPQTGVQGSANPAIVPAATIAAAESSEGELPSNRLLASSIVCAATGIVGLGGAVIGIQVGPSAIPLGPTLGIATAAVGGAIVGAANPRTDAEIVDAAWGSLGASTGFAVIGLGSAVLGYQVGAPLDPSRPFIGGFYGAMGFGLVGGAIGAGAGLLAATALQSSL